MKIIEHKAVVTDVDGDVIDVEMTVADACASCKAKAACGLDGQKRKLLRLEIQDGQRYSKGETVMIDIETIMGVKAVVYSYIIPFFILLGVLLVLLSVGTGEMIAGCSSLGAMLLYYGVLYLFRHRLERTIRFRVRKIDDTVGEVGEEC